MLPAPVRLSLCLFGIAAGFTARPVAAQDPMPAGYRDFNYGTTVISSPTAEKPESKLWWNDGFWWGSLWDPAANKYRIHRFEVATQSWINTGTDIDDRRRSLGDALWDGQRLYVASHIYAGGSQQSGNTTPANSGRLYRYSYNAATDTYNLDAGFPVLVNSAQSETLVLDKDSSGQLWVTWTQGNKVYINRSLESDLVWGTPFVLPVQGGDLDGDDISTIIAFGGNKIGVMWSNQIDLKTYFAVHLDSNPDTEWEPREVALADPNLGALADDHLNVKMMSANGNLYAVTKTSLGGSNAPRIYALKRTPAGVWTKYVVSNGSASHTRPIVILDEENNDLYVFASGGGVIRMKKVSLDNISFQPGNGEAFIQNIDGSDIDNPTAGKRNVNSATGLLVLASTQGSHYYFHNYLDLPSSAPASISSFSPASGPPGTLVTITGSNFNGVVNVAFNGASAASFSVNSGSEITAVVPTGATSGKISVTKSVGTAVSANDFIVTPPPQYTLSVNLTGSGSVTLNPPGGVYETGSVVTLTAIPGSGHQFSSWNGALSGSANPTTIAMDGNKTVVANFTVSSGGQVVHRETQMGGSSNSTTVTSWTSLTGVNGHLYLAAIATKATVAVSSVSGLGLTWTRLQAQCAGRNQTGMEVWMAQGTTSGSGVVTATLADMPSNAVIAVSRYSGVDATNPIGIMVSGNTNGINGSCSGGSDNASYAFDLAATMHGGAIYGAAAMRNRLHTPGAGYTERGEHMQDSSSVGTAASLAVQDKSFPAAALASVNGSFNGSVDWAVVALELKPGTGGGTTQYSLTANTVGSGSVNLNPAGGLYDAGTVVTLTAVPASGWQFSGWSGALSGSANPAQVTMNANQSVTATFTAGGGSAQVVHQETKTGGSSDVVTLSTSASLTGVTGHLYLAAIATKSNVSVSSVSGLGLAWTNVRAQCAGRNQAGVEIWQAQGTPSGNGVVTATFASAPSNAVIAVSRYSGADLSNPIGNIVSGNTNGASGACSGGTDNSSYSFDLAVASAGAMAYGAATMRGDQHTPGAGYTERAEIDQGASAGTKASVAVQDRSIASPGTITVNGTFGGAVDWAMVALEIKPQAGAAKPGLFAENAISTPPAEFQLEQNYPNPFNPSTTINFVLPMAGTVRVKIFSQTGQLVRTLVAGERAAGRHTVRWDGRNRHGQNVAAGVYLYQMSARDDDGATAFTQTRRMTLLE